MFVSMSAIKKIERQNMSMPGICQFFVHQLATTITLYSYKYYEIHFFKVMVEEKLQAHQNQGVSPACSMDVHQQISKQSAC